MAVTAVEEPSFEVVTVVVLALDVDEEGDEDLDDDDEDLDEDEDLDDDDVDFDDDDDELEEGFDGLVEGAAEQSPSKSLPQMKSRERFAANIG